mmetsp:Transcript_131656/g.253374  ORF Transcript_131656/g.253374 Transcript_131656/m.253374 type:complete len:314 (-) Transcript_131656:121-1062(-)
MALSAAAACAVLGVSVGCPFEDVRRAYRQQLLHAHPDKGGDPEAFRRIRRAWEFLATRHGLAQRKSSLSRAIGASGGVGKRRRASGPAVRRRPCMPEAAVQQAATVEKNAVEDLARGGPAPRLASVRLSTLLRPAEGASTGEAQRLTQTFEALGRGSKRKLNSDPLETWRATARAAARVASAANSPSSAAAASRPSQALSGAHGSQGGINLSAESQPLSAAAAAAAVSPRAAAAAAVRASGAAAAAVCAAPSAALGAALESILQRSEKPLWPTGWISFEQHWAAILRRTSTTCLLQVHSRRLLAGLLHWRSGF